MFHCRYTEDMELDDAIHTAILTLKEGYLTIIVCWFCLPLLSFLKTTWWITNLQIWRTNLRQQHWNWDNPIWPWIQVWYRLNQLVATIYQISYSVISAKDLNLLAFLNCGFLENSHLFCIIGVFILKNCTFTPIWVEAHNRLNLFWRIILDFFRPFHLMFFFN